MSGDRIIVAKVVTLLENSKEFLIIDYPNIITTEEYENNKDCFSTITRESREGIF